MAQRRTVYWICVVHKPSGCVIHAHCCWRRLALYQTSTSTSSWRWSYSISTEALSSGVRIWVWLLNSGHPSSVASTLGQIMASEWMPRCWKSNFRTFVIMGYVTRCGKQQQDEEKTRCRKDAKLAVIIILHLARTRSAPEVSYLRKCFGDEGFNYVLEQGGDCFTGEWRSYFAWEWLFFVQNFNVDWSNAS